MVRRALLILFCIGCSAYTFAQPLKNPNYYFALPELSQDARDMYAKMFNINTSPKSYSILDSVFTKNDLTRPFYIYLVCTMLDSAEGDLRVELNVICRYLVEQKPNHLTEVLFSKNSMVKQGFKESWAHRMGVELRITCTSDPMFCFKKSRNIALGNCDEDHKSKLELLYNLVRRDMKLFQQNQ